MNALCEFNFAEPMCKKLNKKPKSLHSRGKDLQWTMYTALKPPPPPKKKKRKKKEAQVGNLAFYAQSTSALISGRSEKTTMVDGP